MLGGWLLWRRFYVKESSSYSAPLVKWILLKKWFISHHPSLTDIYIRLIFPLSQSLSVPLGKGFDNGRAQLVLSDNGKNCLIQNKPVSFAVSYKETKIDMYLVGGWTRRCLGYLWVNKAEGSHEHNMQRNMHGFLFLKRRGSLK